MIVLDCCAAIEMAKNTETGAALRYFIEPEEELVAPVLFAMEAANAAWAHVHAGGFDAETGQNLMADTLAMPDRLLPVEELLLEAYAEAVALDHSVYDMIYLVLARRHAATLLTCDKRLQECCLKRNVDCVWETSL